MIEKIQIICGDYDEAIKGLSNESAGRLFKALIAFAEDRDPSEELEGDIPSNTLFPVLKNHVIRNEEYRKTKAESGRRGGKSGGAPIGNSNASKTKQNKANESKTKQTEAPNLTLPNLTNKVYKPNQFTSGVTIQAYDFAELEKKVVKN